MKNIVLENEIVQLRPIEIGDTEAIRKAANDERIWEHMSVSLLDLASVESYVKNAIAEREKGNTYTFVVIDKKMKRIAGCTSFLDISLPHKRVEIGSTWYEPSVWRSAINTNCKFLLLQYGFEELQLNRIQIKTGHENYRSQQAIERIGAVKEGVLRSHMIRKEGTIRHTVMYSIVAEEWEQVKIRFTTELLNK